MKQPAYQFVCRENSCNRRDICERYDRDQTVKEGKTLLYPTAEGTDCKLFKRRVR